MSDNKWKSAARVYGAAREIARKAERGGRGGRERAGEQVQNASKSKLLMLIV